MPRALLPSIRYGKSQFCPCCNHEAGENLTPPHSSLPWELFLPRRRHSSVSSVLASSSKSTLPLMATPVRGKKRLVVDVDVEVDSEVEVAS
jgi:hypothetical protein